MFHACRWIIFLFFKGTRHYSGIVSRVKERKRAIIGQDSKEGRSVTDLVWIGGDQLGDDESAGWAAIQMGNQFIYMYMLGISSLPGSDTLNILMDHNLFDF